MSSQLDYSKLHVALYSQLFALLLMLFWSECLAVLPIMLGDKLAIAGVPYLPSHNFIIFLQKVFSKGFFSIRSKNLSLSRVLLESQ